jgi:hypothetical protein
MAFRMPVWVNLIISDNGPRESYKEGILGKVTDSKGTFTELQRVLYDPMPQDLISRSYGRLRANCPASEIGLFTTYIKDSRIWQAQGKEALSLGYKEEVLESIHKYYRENSYTFIKAPRY